MGTIDRQRDECMTTSELLTTLKSLKQELKTQFGIEKIALFGSYARGEATEESDVDIAVISMDEKNYFTLIAAIHYLEEKLNRKIDMGYFDAIRPFIKQQIKDEIIYV